VLDPLVGLPLGQFSAGALVGLVVLLILMGRLVPRQSLLDMREDRDKWRTTAEDWQRAATQLGMSMEKLLVLAETTNHALHEIQELAARRIATLEQEAEDAK
jgi:hypothetical protein